MIIGRITAKAQTTVPRAVRLALGLGPGDAIVYEIEGGNVSMRKAANVPDDPFALFDEWADELDSAYDAL